MNLAVGQRWGAWKGTGGRRCTFAGFALSWGPSRALPNIVRSQGKPCPTSQGSMSTSLAVTACLGTVRSATSHTPLAPASAPEFPRSANQRRCWEQSDPGGREGPGWPDQRWEGMGAWRGQGGRPASCGHLLSPHSHRPQLGLRGPGTSSLLDTPSSWPPPPR